MNDYERKNTSFERAVNLLQENLQYLANKGVVSNRFISLQNNIIKSLIDYQKASEQRISTLELEHLELQHLLSNHIDKYQEKILVLEAICFIHGIMDLDVWLNTNFSLLEEQATESFKEGSFSIPLAFNIYFNNMSKEDKAVINKILDKKAAQHTEQELNKIKEQINGIRTQRNQETIRG